MAPKPPISQPVKRTRAEKKKRGLQRQQRDAAKKRAQAQDRFLAVYSHLGTVAGTCRQLQMSRETHRQWLDKDPTYQVRFERAEEEAIEALEEEMRRRALRGWLEPVYGDEYDPESKRHKKRKIGTLRKYSDVLLIFALKAKRPEIYREQKTHTSAKGTTIFNPGSGLTVNVGTLPVEQMSTEDLIAEAKLLIEQLTRPTPTLEARATKSEAPQE